MLTQQQEIDVSPPFLTLSKRLSDIFSLTSQRLKLISDSISSSLDSQARAIHDAPTSPRSHTRNLSSPSKHPIALVSPLPNHSAPGLQPQAFTPLAPAIRSHNSNGTTRRDIDHAPSIEYPDRTPGGSYLNVQPLSPTPSWNSNNVDGIPVPIGSENTPSELCITSRPDHVKQSFQLTVNQDGYPRPAACLSSDLNSMGNSDVSGLAPKSLLERIADPSPPPRNGVSEDVLLAHITSNSSASSTSMSFSHSSHSCEPNRSERNNRRSSYSLSPPHRRSSHRPSSQHGSERAMSRPAQVPKRLSTRPSSPADSYDSRKSHHHRQYNSHRSSRDVYDSYHPPSRSTTYPSRSRSPSTLSRRRGSVAAAKQFSASSEDRRRCDYDAYLEETGERPSYMRLISILRSLQAPNYRHYVFIDELLKEFNRFTERAETHEERMLGYLYKTPRLMHRFLMVAMRRHIIIYRADSPRFRESTVELAGQFCIRSNSDRRR